MVNTMQDFTYITSGEYLKAPEHLRTLLNGHFLVDTRPAVASTLQYFLKHFPFLTSRERYTAYEWYDGYADSIKLCVSTTGLTHLSAHWKIYSSNQNPVVIALHKLQDDYTHHQVEVARAHITHQ